MAMGLVVPQHSKAANSLRVTQQALVTAMMLLRPIIQTPLGTKTVTVTFMVTTMPCSISVHNRPDMCSTTRTA